MRLLTSGCVALLVATTFTSIAHAEDAPVHELRIYTTNEGKLPNLNARFRDHTTRLFEKHGMTNIAYWTPTDPALRDNTLIYFLRHDSRGAAKQSWAAFVADPEWKAAAAKSEEGGKILAKAPEAYFMTATDFSPNNLKSADKPRLFELRKYTCVPGRLPKLHQRFREGELDLFSKAGMTHIMYFEPTDMPDTLFYVVAHDDEDAAKKSWAAFRADPEWIKLRDASEADGPIVMKVESTMLEPVDYSTLK